MTSVEGFYEDLSAHYHLLYADWDAAVAGQGRVLDGLLVRRLGPGPRSVLDAACGIGTQAIGLALCGHRVEGSDLSAAALARAAAEAERFGVALPLRRADLRRPPEAFGRAFEVAAVLDNGLAHFLSQPELEAAAAGLAGVLEPGGLLLASLRDYDRLRETRPAATPLGLFPEEGGRRMVFQVWDWAEDGETYEQTLYIVRHRPGGPGDPDKIETLAFRTRSRAIARAELEAALSAAGFREIAWSEPEDSGFYQPIVTARLP